MSANARRAALACAAAMAWTGFARDAEAWYFPEHVVLAHDALAQLTPEARAVLEEAVARANKDGLGLCAKVDVALEDVAQRRQLRTKMIRSDVSVDCVPYGALPALAGDHANSADELRAVLSSPKGIEITSAVAFEWMRFREAVARLPNTSLERMSFVHDLDVAFYFIDPGYELRAQATRAHFVDAGRSLHEVVRAAAITGNVDNALGQFMAHHLRALGLAAHGEPTPAILEHAFALHFLEDAFAAGHLVMTDATWTAGNTHARQRHDFFNAKGLGVRRAMNVESCGALDAAQLEPLGLAPCWSTSGDGYLGITKDASDRVHAARAVAQAELEFALALDPARVARAAFALGEGEQLVLGQLLEPIPWWTLAPGDRTKVRASAARTRMLVRGAVAAIDRLRASEVAPRVDVGTPPRTSHFEPGVLSRALDPCAPRERLDPALFDPDDTVPCGATFVLALGTVGVSLLRPLLAEWPSTQMDASTLYGEARGDLGWAVQLLAFAQAGALLPPHAPIDFYAPSISVAAGVSYRWGTYLPGRLNRSVAEANVGITESLHYDSTGRAGGSPHVTMLDQELRWPVVWELLTSYLLPLDLTKSHEAGGVLFLSGARVHELVTTSAPVFWGFELEAAAIALSRGSGVNPLYATSPELRIYLGAADPTAAQPSYPRAWAPSIGVALTGGYATFF